MIVRSWKVSSRPRKKTTESTETRNNRCSNNWSVFVCLCVSVSLLCCLFIFLSSHVSALSVNLHELQFFTWSDASKCASSFHRIDLFSVFEDGLLSIRISQEGEKKSTRSTTGSWVSKLENKKKKTKGSKETKDTTYLRTLDISSSHLPAHLILREVFVQ